MNLLIDDYTLFKKKIKELIGIDLDGYKDEQIKRRVKILMDRVGAHNFLSFYKAIEKDQQLRKDFIDKVTINVSEFFRNTDQFDLLKNKIIPELRNRFKKLSIWSAGCSYGNEPYSVAIILDELGIREFNMLATDIDMEALKKAKEGIYKLEELKNITEERLKRYFTKLDNDHYKISDRIRLSVRFEYLDLLKDKYPKGMHLILCRNVIIYFTQEAKDGVFRKLAESLEEDGILFLGNTERIFNPQNYKLKPVDLFFYKKVV
ncbi:protein-glutamate O-methyltransferase CheR [bacterium]|nr:protein-glutamate O-methyltransferase CheR [bacterium]